jgi:hypothetical protein
VREIEVFGREGREGGSSSCGRAEEQKFVAMTDVKGRTMVDA